jgi:hypothetical protein
MIPVGPPEIDFSLSGQGPTIGGEITLQDVQKGACQRGFVKEGVPPDAPEAKRANVAGFFRILGVNSLTGFKKRFYAEHLPEPHPGMKPLIAEKVRPGGVANDESEKTGLPQGHQKTKKNPPASRSESRQKKRRVVHAPLTTPRPFFLRPFLPPFRPCDSTSCLP